MVKSKIASIQYTAYANTGGMRRLPTNYKISETPIGDETKYGYLAYVSDKQRKKIMGAGFGELEAHIEYIKKQIGHKRAYNKKFYGQQLRQAQADFDFEGA